MFSLVHDFKRNVVHRFAHIACGGLFLIFALAGCTPGYSLKTISETSSAIVIEYTHSVGGELQAAVQTAQARCQQYGKNARMNGQPTRINMDRSVATFDCVTP